MISAQSWQNNSCHAWHKLCAMTKYNLFYYYVSEWTCLCNVGPHPVYKLLCPLVGPPFDIGKLMHEAQEFGVTIGSTTAASFSATSDDATKTDVHAPTKCLFPLVL